MNQYKKVAEATALAQENTSQVARSATVHAMIDGATATLCGAHALAEVLPVLGNRVVSCAACTTALVNMRRASDHLPLASIDTPDIDVYLADMLSLRSTKAFREDDQNLGRVLANVSSWLLLGHEPHDAKLPDSTSVPQAGDAALTQDTELCRFCGKHVATPCDTPPADVCEAATERDEALNLAQPREHTYSVQVVSRDAVVEANRKLLLERSNVGIEKYGVTLAQSGLTHRQLLQHALEESLDHANYLQAILMQTPQ